MRGRQLGAGRYGAGDLTAGDWYLTPGVTVTEAHILTFAGLTGDFFDVHVDDEFARSAGFPGRIAHGLLTLGLVDGLKNRSVVQLNAVASLGWSCSFRAPVLPGDRITAEISVVDIRPTSKPHRSVVVLNVTASKQTSEVVLDGTTTLLMRT